MASRLVIGRDAEVIRETDDGVEVEARVRLRPGFVIEVAPRVAGGAGRSGAALVWSWRLLAVGSAGPTYRGICRWHRPEGNQLPAGTRQVPWRPGKDDAAPGIALDNALDA